MSKIIYCTKTDDGMIEDFVDDDLMIYDEPNEKIFLLNETSKLIWNFINENTKIEYVENLVFDNYKIPEQERDSVKKDIQEILNDWEINGLIVVLRK